jgi:uncharacterized protein YbjT (DUF2867 family)
MKELAMYAVMGVTGKVGGAVARALAETGAPVRAIVRDAAKGKAWAAQSDVALADVHDKSALAAAFAGCEGVFVMLPPTFDPAPGFPEAAAMIASLREALLLAAPGRIVALSTIGAQAAEPNLLNQLGMLERALADLPTPVTFLRAAWFIENAASDVASARDEGVIHSYLQPLDRAVPMISSEDVGRTAAALLQAPWAGHRVVELEAAERVSPLDLVQAFAEALGRPVRAEVVPRNEWEAIFRAEGMRNPTPRMQMLDGFNAGWIDFLDRGAGARKGAISLKQTVAALVRQA